MSFSAQKPIRAQKRKFMSDEEKLKNFPEALYDNTKEKTSEVGLGYISFYHEAIPTLEEIDSIIKSQDNNYKK